MSPPLLLIAGAADSLDGLEAALRSAGLEATVQRAALLAIEPPDDWAPLDQTLDRLDRYSAIAFTSPRAAEAVQSRVESRESGVEEVESRESRVESRVPVWAVGPATAEAVRSFGWSGPLHVSKGTGGADLAREMLTAGVRGHVLHPCGDPHRPELATGLRAEGVSVDEPICYRSVLAEVSTAGQALERADAVVVTSPRVAALLARARRDARPPLVAIGPATAGAAVVAGWAPDAVAEEPTPKSVGAALTRLLDVRAGKDAR